MSDNDGQAKDTGNEEKPPTLNSDLPYWAEDGRSPEDAHEEYTNGGGGYK